MKRGIVVFICLFLVAGVTGFSGEKKVAKTGNIFPEGNMEKEKIVPEKDPQMMAVPARENANGWCGNPKDCIEFVKDAHSGKLALKVKSTGKPVWVNRFVPVKATEGTLTFYYKIISPEKEGELIFYMVPWSWERCEVDQRSSVSVSVKEASDGKWHKATINFYSAVERDGFMLAPRIATEGASEIPAEWIIDDIEIFPASDK